jgi:PiT family inorganic phosphate transporter
MNFGPLIIFAATLFVAYANGANDNFKGVATLFGSATTDYRRALWWATVTTLAGSIAAFFLATRMISIFQGQGLVPGSVVQSRAFVGAVILGTALTVMVATKIGMPVSTTHGLTGALLGSGFLAVGFQISFATLLHSFVLPLLTSPFLAIGVAAAVCPVFSRALRSSGLTGDNCLCVASQAGSAAVTPAGVTIIEPTPGLRVILERQSVCAPPTSSALLGVDAQKLLDLAHFLSAGAVSFARGLNDTPKIVALGLALSVLEPGWSIACVAAAMSLGGLVHSRKIAETVSKRITNMDPEQGLLANLVTSTLVIFASNWGLPVSTTHVSCGALFGIGMANGQAHWQVIRTILLAWLLTLPTAATLSAVCYSLLQRFA